MHYYCIIGTHPDHVDDGNDEVWDHGGVDGDGEEEVGALDLVDGVAGRRPEEQRGRDEEEVARRHHREGGRQRQARDLRRRDSINLLRVAQCKARLN